MYTIKNVLNEQVDERSLNKKLTSKQLELLLLIYKYRFVTTSLVANYFNQSHLQTANERLAQLFRLGYVLKRNDSSYRLAHRPVEYYAAIQCIAVIREYCKNYSERELKQLYARPNVSDRFVFRSIFIFAAYLKLRTIYGVGIHLFTKAELNIDVYNYLPQPLPDGFVTIPSHDDMLHSSHIFLEYFDDAVSIGIHSRQISKYIKYHQDGLWDKTNRPFPLILILCSSDSMVIKTQKRIKYMTRDEIETCTFITVTLDSLHTIK